MKAIIYPTIWLCLSIILFSGCKGKTSSAEFTEEEYIPRVLSLENVANAKGEEFLSSIATTIRYVPLETTDASLIRQVSKVILLNNGNFVISDAQNIHLFSSEGKFIRPISQRGNGPADYIRISALVPNHLSGGFFIQTNKKVVEFDAEGNYVKNFETEDRPMDMAFDGEGHLLLHRMNIPKAPEDTTTTWFLFRYNVSGEELRRFEDVTPRMGGEGIIPIVTPQRPMYLYKKKIRFNEFGNDTIFTVEEEHLKPYAIIQLGNMRMSASPEGTNAEMDAVFGEMQKKLFLSFLLEDDQFFYLSFGWGFGGNFLFSTYNKKNGRVTNYGDGAFNNANGGLTNDIDGGLPFYPQTILPNGIRIMQKSAESFKKAISEKDYNTVKKEYADKFEAVWQLANSLKEDDNPVLILVE